MQSARHGTQFRPSAQLSYWDWFTVISPISRHGCGQAGAQDDPFGHQPEANSAADRLHRLPTVGGMTSFERASLVAAFAGVLVALVAFVVELRLLRRQVAQATKSTKLDHERRRMQATIEFYETTLNKRAELRAYLPYDRDAPAVAALIARVLHEDDQAGKAITEYLSLFELLAAGVRTGVFDHDVIKRIAGGRIVAITANYRPWIEARRKLYRNPALYQEIEWLAQSFETPLARPR
jgi:hypothetical protein